MKRILLVVALLLAVPAQAQTSRYVGTWLSGSSGADMVKVLRLKVRDKTGAGWGASVGKGYLPYLQVRKTTGSATYALVSGAWEDTTEAVALFALGQASCLVPTTGYTDFYAFLVMKKTGWQGYLSADDNAQPFSFRMQRIP